MISHNPLQDPNGVNVDHTAHVDPTAQVSPYRSALVGGTQPPWIWSGPQNLAPCLSHTVTQPSARSTFIATTLPLSATGPYYHANELYTPDRSLGVLFATSATSATTSARTPASAAAVAATTATAVTARPPAYAAA